MKGAMTINTTNDHLITKVARDVLVQIPIQGPISRESAIRAAAWLLVIADPKESKELVREWCASTDNRFVNTLSAILT
jgi:hypothetical protein